MEDPGIPWEIYPQWMGSGCSRTYYSYQWWGHVNCDSSYQFFASGNLGQEIYILPEEEILIIHCGNSLEYYISDLLRSATALIKKK